MTNVLPNMLSEGMHVTQDCTWYNQRMLKTFQNSSTGKAYNAQRQSSSSGSSSSSAYLLSMDGA
jgi:hypothetical protein